MYYKIFPPNSIDAEINLPASKSLSNRSLIINALSNDQISVENVSASDDTRLLFNALRSKSTEVDIGAAGTAMRFLTAFFAQEEGVRILTGSERMKQRPIGFLVEALRSIGAQIQYLEKEGFPPLKISGCKLTGGAISLNGSVSSQYLSALMMIAPTMKYGLTIQLLGNVISRPYIEMTAKLMHKFGVESIIKDDLIIIPKMRYLPRKYNVENDWSAASYWYEIAAMFGNSSRIVLNNLPKNSLQGDSQVMNIFSMLGVETSFENCNAILTNNKIDDFNLPLNINFENTPDIAQTFVVTACMLGIKFCASGLQSLRIKETDRISALQIELRKLGFVLTTPSDGVLEWDGVRCEPDFRPIINTYDDHRMAMAFAPVCIKFGEILIKDPYVVSKSYPRFWEDLEKAGFMIEKIIE